jgi:hypothetical protein
VIYPTNPMQGTQQIQRAGAQHRATSSLASNCVARVRAIARTPCICCMHFVGFCICQTQRKLIQSSMLYRSTVTPEVSPVLFAFSTATSLNMCRGDRGCHSLHAGYSYCKQRIVFFCSSTGGCHASHARRRVHLSNVEGIVIYISF